MDLTSDAATPADDAATTLPRDDIEAWVQFCVAAACAKVCTGSPLDGQVVAEAADAHSHTVFADTMRTVLDRRRRCVQTARALAARVGASLRRPRLVRFIMSSEAARHRPTLDASGTLRLGASRAVRTKTHRQIVAMWDLLHAAPLAGQLVVEALPERGNSDEFAAALLSAIEAHCGAAVDRIVDATAVAQNKL